MRMTPNIIARALVDSMLFNPSLSPDAACDSAIQLMHERCPGTPRRTFIRLVEREVSKRGIHSEGMLVVPHEHALQAAHLEPGLRHKKGKPVHLDRKVEPEIIGGAVLLVDHRRIDCSIQGALHALLRSCLEPLDASDLSSPQS